MARAPANGVAETILAGDATVTMKTAMAARVFLVTRLMIRFSPRARPPARASSQSRCLARDRVHAERRAEHNRMLMQQLKM
jgi:hypothetical protein